VIGSKKEAFAFLRHFLGEKDMMAYLVANRLLELHRVLKPICSLYLQTLILVSRTVNAFVLTNCQS